MKIEFNWEVMDAQTLRAKIFGGWLVRFHGTTGAVALTVVTDPDHAWQVEVPPAVLQASRERLVKLEHDSKDPYLDDGIRAEMTDEMENLRRFIASHE